MSAKSVNDVEAQNHQTSQVQQSRSSSVRSPRSESLRSRSPVQSAHSSRPDLETTVSVKSARNSRDEKHDLQDESQEEHEKQHAVRLFLFGEELHGEKRPAEPWFLEMTTLRRLNFIEINYDLAKLKKKIFEERAAQSTDMAELRKLLHDQADAIRDFAYIRSLDYLSAEEKNNRYEQSKSWFQDVGQTDYRSDPLETRAYRRLHNTKDDPYRDGVRHFLLRFLPVSLTWTKGEKDIKPELYREKRQPTTPSDFVEGLAKFLVAIIGALFILVPMYIMALNVNRTKNLITTTISVVLFAFMCSITLRTRNDQTLAATTGYAAVLMVFVGLTTQGSNS